MTLDEAERIAREVIERDARGSAAGYAVESYGLKDSALAKALLAVMPVIRSLLAELERGEDEEGNSTMVTVATLDAIDQMRRKMEKQP